MNAKQSPNSKTVCIIGNSYTGALRKAYQTGDIDTEPYRFCFFATPGDRFNDVGIEDGTFTNIQFGDSASMRVDDYDAVIIYANMPLPSEVSANFRSAPYENYSIAVRKACLLTWLMSFASFRLLSALAAWGAPKIILLSRNYLVQEKLGAHADWIDGVALIQEMIRPASYLPAPKHLFSYRGRPRAEFYHGSLNVFGEEPDRAAQPLHHIDHLNLAGGKVMLAAIVDHLRDQLQ